MLPAGTLVPVRIDVTFDNFIRHSYLARSVNKINITIKIFEINYINASGDNRSVDIREMYDTRRRLSILRSCCSLMFTFNVWMWYPINIVSEFKLTVVDPCRVFAVTGTIIFRHVGTLQDARISSTIYQ